jgi:chemotaxis protein methyltransferase CheR
MPILKNDMLTFFSNTIEKETGILYTEANAYLLESRLRELACTLGFAGVEAMWAEVGKRGLKPAEKDMILDLSTNNETSFFRDPEVFDFFRDEFIAKRTRADQKVHIWCAASSTGQEPYSLAMILDQLRERGAGRDYDILATDFSQRVLARCRDGTYSHLEVQRGLSAPLLIKYFEQVTSETSTIPKFRIKDQIKKHITFKHLNLLAPWPQFGPFNIIFCRNVLIYQDVQNKKQVISRMARLLAPDGYLILGGAESLIGLSDEFDMELHGKACVYRRKGGLRTSA